MSASSRASEMKFEHAHVAYVTREACAEPLRDSFICEVQLVFEHTFPGNIISSPLGDR